MVNWHLDRSPLCSIHQIVSTISNSVNVLAPHQASHLGIGISLLETLTFQSVIVVKIKNVVGCTSLIRVSNLILVLHLSYLLALSILLFFHVFPSFQVSLILLNSKQLLWIEVVTYLLESMISCFLLFAFSLFSFSMAAKSRLKRSFSGKK